MVFCVGSRDLFNAAFVSCWTELSEMQQDELIQSIEQALAIQDIPEITQTLLNLAEFMEHCEKVCTNNIVCTTAAATTPTFSFCLLVIVSYQKKSSPARISTH